MKPMPRTIREQVTEHIRGQVVAGEFAPGEPLRETEFAERFGVSRGPVRDAFLQLAQEGLLAYQAHRGVTVRQPPKPENRPIIVSLRQQIECFVVGRGLDRWDHDSLADVAERLDELRKACDREDAAAVARADVGFHEAVLTHSGGEDFLPIWKWLCSQMLLAYSRLENYQQVHREHVDILDALRERDEAAVVAALKSNVQ